MFHYIIYICALIIFTNGDLLDDLQVEKRNLRSALAFLERLDGNEAMKYGNSSVRPSNCAEVMLLGQKKSGIYTIYPRPLYMREPFKVYCDMETAGGGWTVFQRRGDYPIQEHFFRGWKDYKYGFGTLNRDFWLGNTYLFLLTHQDEMTMRIDMEDFEGKKRYAHYKKFQIDNDNNSYKLTIGGFTGDAGDDMGPVNGVNFVTFNRNDVNACAQKYKGGWWYLNCHWANLNGLYLRGNHQTFADGVNWKSWKGYNYSLKRTEMKLRPVNFLDYEE